MAEYIPLGVKIVHSNRILAVLRALFVPFLRRYQNNLQQENMRWILKQQRLEDEAKEDEGRPKSHKALASRWMSRRGCLDSILFPSALPAVLSQKPARADSDSSGPDTDGAASSGEKAGEGGARSPPRGGKKKHVCEVSGRPAKYRDPLTGSPYADAAAFKELRRRFGPSVSERDQENQQDRDSKGADGRSGGGSAGAGSDSGTVTVTGGGAASGAGGGATGSGSGSTGTGAGKGASGSGQQAGGPSTGNSKKHGASKDAEKKTKSVSSKGKGKASKKDPTKSSPMASKAEVPKAEVSVATDSVTTSGDLIANGVTSTDTVSSTPVRAKVENKGPPARADGKEQKSTKRARKQGSGTKGTKPAKRPFFAPAPAPASGAAVGSGTAAAAAAPVAGNAVELELVPLKAPAAAAYRDDGLSPRAQKLATPNAGVGVVGITSVDNVRAAQKMASAAAPLALGGLQRSTVAPRTAAVPIGRSDAAVMTAPTTPSMTAVAPMGLDVEGGAAEVAKKWEGAIASASAPVYLGWQQPGAGGASAAAPEQRTPR